MDFPTEERGARVLLNLHPKLGPVRFARLLERFGSAAAALQAPDEEWESLGIGASALKRGLCRLDPYKEENRARALGVRILIDRDPEYPEGLRNLRDAPGVLYVLGGLEARDAYSVALVGTRQPTAYGRTAAERLARELAQSGVSVVSGLARGIDTAAHAAALTNGGRSVGFLGSGFDEFYPPENRGLAERLAKNGAVVTEFPLGAAPDKGNFPRRNRLIAAASLGVVVVEAQARSGALITAALAARLGKDVFAVPGSIFSTGSRGPHSLIKQGAKPVETVEDLIEEIAPLRELLQGAERGGAGRAVPSADLTADEGQVLALLSLDPRGVDGLAAACGMTAPRILAALLTLELAGLARELPGKRFVRTERALAAPTKDGI